MTALAIILIVMAGLALVATLLSPLLIGKPQSRRTAGTTLFQAVVNLCYIAVYLLAALALLGVFG